MVGHLEVDQVTGHLRLEIVRGVGGDDLAAVDDDGPVAEGVGLFEVVGGEEDRCPDFLRLLDDVEPCQSR